MTAADLIAGTVIGALSGMGVGGAGLLIIYLTAFRGISQQDAQGINLYFFIFASAAAMFVHAAKRNIDYKRVVFCLITGIPAAYLGCMTAASVSPELLRRIFGGMLVLTGMSVFLKKR